MKSSRYNIIIDKDNYSYWFNGLSVSYFKISHHTSDKLRELLNDTDNIKIVSPSLYSNLREKGFIVEDNFDELNEVILRHEYFVHKKDYFLVLMPTLNCNYSCWYCIQDHIPSKMSNDIIEKIKRHIDYMINIEKIESLTVDWFGGEPLLYIHDVIEPLSLHMLNACKEANIPFYNGATTNGFFLNTLEPKLDALNFNRFQITIDGNKKFHDKVKFTNGCISTFDHVLKSINNVLSKHQTIRVILRINYTHGNLDESIVDEISKIISVENRDRVIITPRKVWQESVDKSFSLPLQNILYKFRSEGFSVEWWDFITNYTSCYTNKKYYNAILHNGRVVKCTASDDLYDESVGGLLQDDGTILWKGEMDKKFLCSTFENELCLKCNRLPICMGLCPRNILRGDSGCKLSSVENSYKEGVVNYIDDMIRAHTLKI